MELSLTTRSEGRFEVIEVGGEIDVLTAPRLREAVVEAVGRGRLNLIIDVQKVDFLDSTGLGVLVGALKRVRADGGSLDIVCTNARLLKIFEITGLDKVFGLHESVEAARLATGQEDAAPREV
ncbi:anti-sigma factor antagonist BldG [Aeromicrobium halocynthiae]|uniref:Anti-sigma factor antagonist n=1 Tax=Aeromicrobium halocynthiae TaxID=560557 RepID=A0ABN2W3A4_9ACTN